MKVKNFIKRRQTFTSCAILEVWGASDIDEDHLDATPENNQFSILKCEDGYLTMTNNPPKFNPYTGEALEYI